MLQIFRKKDGAVSVFLTIILVPMIVVSCLFVDACRAKLAEPVVSSAGDLTLNTALTQYDATLNDYYGLMASSQNVDEFLNKANELLDASKEYKNFSGIADGMDGSVKFIFVSGK